MNPLKDTDTVVSMLVRAQLNLFNIAFPPSEVTAKAIAQEVGIITLKETIELVDMRKITMTSMETAIVIHGSTLRDMTSEELDSVIFGHHEIVFARTSPTQKLQIVESCQRLGEIGKIENF